MPDLFTKYIDNMEGCRNENTYAWGFSQFFLSMYDRTRYFDDSPSMKLAIGSDFPEYADIVETFKSACNKMAAIMASDEFYPGRPQARMTSYHFPDDSVLEIDYGKDWWDGTIDHFKEVPFYMVLSDG